MTLPNLKANPLPNLPGYRLSEQLYAGSRTVVYRGIEVAQQKPVVIKVLRQAYPSFNEIVQFCNQYAIHFAAPFKGAPNLDIPGIVRPLSLEPWQNGYALVMEDSGSISLAQYAREQPLDLSSVLNIGLQLAEILHQLHNNYIIHKDIKPANILIDPETQQVQLIDFSISSLLPKETQEIQNPNVLEGTLAYIAPEQTGRMNRGIDYRADFYSLGVTLYELLTGKLPFQSDDPLELIYAHIAKAPIPPHQLEAIIPVGLSALVLKLMAKNAEERYQSGLGLKDDLEKCLKQWQETGEIAEFELGQRDLCDRFIIPEKLYGREAEVARLLEAFDRVSGREQGTGDRGQGIGDRGQGTGKGYSPLPTADCPRAEMMLVAGFFGIGKTAVVNEVHKPITCQRGYFIKGKFDQFNRDIPFSAFVRAFRDLMAQLLADSDAQIAQWRSQILQAVGNNGQVLIEVIPELERIVGEQPPVPELSGTASQNRFNLIFQKFIAVFTTPEHPLVIFLDDLQWADLASLQLIKLLMQDTSYLLLLGAYRDNEVSPAHPLLLAVEELKKTGTTVNTLTLAPLDRCVINQLVADSLRCPPSGVMPLTDLIDAKTQGNPFFTTQFLKALYEEGHLTFKRAPEKGGLAARGYWECDIAHLKTLTLSNDVVEFMGQQLQKLSPASQESLKFAACMGDRFDLATLAIALEKTEAEIAVGLWEALQEGLILPQSEIYKLYANYESSEAIAPEAQNVAYRFLHDRVQQAAYGLIPEVQRAQTHYRIGQLLLAKISPERQEERIFELVNQLNAGKDFIENLAERDRLAELNAIACRRARTSIAYNAGRTYAEIGLQVLGEKAWERQYELTLALHEIAVELAYLCGDYPAMEAFIATVLERTRTILDCTNVYLIQIQAQVSRQHLSEAVELGLNVLEQLGVRVPKLSSPEEIGRELAEIEQLMGDREIEDLINLPLTTDRHKIALVKIAKSIFPASSFIHSPYGVSLVTLTIKTLIQYGNTLDAAFCYGSYGRVVCHACNDVDGGLKFGRLGLNLAEKLELKAQKPELFSLVSSTLLYRKFPIRDTLPLSQEGYALALEVGNLEYSLYNVLTYFANAFWANIPLTTLEQDARSYKSVANNFMTFSIQWQTILNLSGFSTSPTVLNGEVYRETKFIAKNCEDIYNHQFFFLYLYKLFLGYLFGDLTGAKTLSHLGRNLAAAKGSVGEPTLYFYEALAILAELPSEQVGTSDAWQQVERHQAQLQQFWAHHAPMNYQHKVDLIEAEKCRLLDRKLEAIEFYDKAIAGAKENEYIQEEALANELAAKFYLAWGLESARPNRKEKIAAIYMQEAYYGYARWGAKAKTDDLERRYPDVLYPVLQSGTASLNVLETLAATLASPHRVSESSSTTLSSSSSLNTALDFSAILKAARSISSTLEVKELLAQLTSIILQNSGAERCALILPDPSGEWRIEAIATSQSLNLQAQSLEGYPDLPIKLIQYVKNIREAIVIDGLKTDLPVLDSYLNNYTPQSLLALPILNQSHLTGIVYLENCLIRSVFNPERLLVVNFLCAQAAISLENARLYKQAQNYAQQLEQSQLQIVQSEKMASLGNLVAGVAHEINNPIGFLNGSVSNASDGFQDLIGHLELYEQCYSNPLASIQDNAEEIDLEFLKEDLPKLVASMQGAIDRIKSISNSLRSFSRADSENPVSANLHEGLDSTLLILKYRLKANEHRPAIEIVKDYGDIPEIECFPGQLNQVFMNILANAIDALDEANAGRSFKEIAAHPHRITVRTRVEESQVKITIADNGNGIPEEVKSRIFDHLFTTKPVGKGTGLGLAISRQIVVEKHNGELEVFSQVGRGTEFCIRLPL